MMSNTEISNVDLMHYGLLRMNTRQTCLLLYQITIGTLLFQSFLKYLSTNTELTVLHLAI